MNDIGGAALKIASSIPFVLSNAFFIIVIVALLVYMVRFTFMRHGEKTDSHKGVFERLLALAAGLLIGYAPNLMGLSYPEFIARSLTGTDLQFVTIVPLFEFVIPAVSGLFVGWFFRRIYAVAISRESDASGQVLADKVCVILGSMAFVLTGVAYSDFLNVSSVASTTAFTTSFMFTTGALLSASLFYPRKKDGQKKSSKANKSEEKVPSSKNPQDPLAFLNNRKDS